MIDIAAIRARFMAMVPFWDERTRRLLGPAKPGQRAVVA